jgi:YD repeat-containing protein
MSEINHWQSVLASVEQSIVDTLTALNRYETSFRAVLGESLVERQLIVWPSLAAWDDKLTVATQHAASVERLLAEHDAVWHDWRTQYDHFQQLVGQFPQHRESPN